MLNGNGDGIVPLKVAIRIRPFIREELFKNEQPCLSCIPGEPQLVIGNNRKFQFDYVFDQECSQEDVYNECVAPLTKSFFDGFNATVFAYGQTGSGKTYTMGIGTCVYLDDIQKGIVPRALSDIFQMKESISQNVLCKMHVTFIEIYREEATDLLDNLSSLQIREDEKGNTVIVGARDEPVDNLDDVLTLLDAGTALRHVGSTKINELSSRSHCIFKLQLEQYKFGEEEAKEGRCLSSTFHFVDLAGSERADRTGNQGTRFKESVSINTGLLALGNVISALSDPKRKKTHVPYRESKLTRLLKNSLGGNSSTVMIACLSPGKSDLDEDINSLKYASRAQKIRNKPIINWNREKTQMDDMKKELTNLRSELKRQQSGHHEHNAKIFEQVDDLKMRNEKHDQKEVNLSSILHEIDAIVHTIQQTQPAPINTHTSEQIERWRKRWKSSSMHHANRPLSAPSSIMKMSHDITQLLHDELALYKERDSENSVLLERKCIEVDELRQEVIDFGEENAKLRLDLDIAINSARDLQDRLFEQQMAIQHLQKQSDSSRIAANLPNINNNTNENRPVTSTRCNQVFERFRVKNDLLVSQIDEMDWVEHDRSISTGDEDDYDADYKDDYDADYKDDENGETVEGLGAMSDDNLEDLDEEIEDEFEKEFVQKYWLRSSHEKPIPISRLPRPIRQKPRPSVEQNGRAATITLLKSKLPVPIDKKKLKELEHLESSRQSMITGAREASTTALKYRRQMTLLREQITKKQTLVTEVEEGEAKATATKELYRKKLANLQKEYDKSMKDLEDARKKITQLEISGPKKSIDPSQRKKLETDYKRKLKVTQRKMKEVKESETATTQMFQYHKNYEQRLKDMEGQLARARNHYGDVNRQLKLETDRKTKFEQELRRNEVRIKELELKTDKQQKVLRRKNEEVVAAQRKLRLGVDQVKESEELGKKRQWLEDEIEKIVSKQKDMELLERDLHDRDLSLQKKEALLKEKDRLESKKSESSLRLSKDIVKLSVKMDTIEEEITLHHYNRGGGGEQAAVDQLHRVHQELTAQKDEMERVFGETGGLETHEERRLIELGEAIEAVEEALQYKNDLIQQKQMSIMVAGGGEDEVEDEDRSSQDLDHHYRNVEFLLDQMGPMSGSEYKHLLGKFFLKITELRKSAQDSDDIRCYLELQASDHDKQLEDARYYISVMEERRESENVAMQRRHEEQVQFLMAQLKQVTETRNHSANLSEKRIRQLEKDLFFYKTKFRQNKELLKDSSHQNSKSIDSSANSEPPASVLTHNGRSSESVTLPPLSNPGRLMESERRLPGGLDPRQVEESKRIQTIFEGRCPESLSRGGNKRKEIQHHISEDFSMADSIEVLSRNPWHNL